jgi:hypothetical protein
MKINKLILFSSMILFAASINAIPVLVEYTRDYFEPDGTQVIIGKEIIDTEEGSVVKEVEIRNINNILKVGRYLSGAKATDKVSPEEAVVIYDALLERKAEKENQR